MDKNRVRASAQALQRLRAAQTNPPQLQVAFIHHCEAAAELLMSPQFTPSHEHWFCERADDPEVAFDSLAMYSYPLETHLEKFGVAEYIERHHQQLRCPRCAVAYQGGLQGLQKRFSEFHFAPENIRRLVQLISDSDAKRIRQAIKEPIEESRIGRLQLSVPLVEALASSTFLLDPENVKLVSPLVLSLKREISATVPPGTSLPGAIALAMASDLDLVSFAWSLLTVEGQDLKVTIPALEANLAATFSANAESRGAWFTLSQILKLCDTPQVYEIVFSVFKKAQPSTVGYWVVLARLIRSQNVNLGALARTLKSKMELKVQEDEIKIEKEPNQTSIQKYMALTTTSAIHECVSAALNVCSQLELDNLLFTQALSNKLIQLGKTSLALRCLCAPMHAISFRAPDFHVLALMDCAGLVSSLAKSDILPFLEDASLVEGVTRYAFISKETDLFAPLVLTLEKLDLKPISKPKLTWLARVLSALRLASVTTIAPVEALAKFLGDLGSLERHNLQKILHSAKPLASLVILSLSPHLPEETTAQAKTLIYQCFDSSVGHKLLVAEPALMDSVLQSIVRFCSAANSLKFTTRALPYLTQTISDPPKLAQAFIDDAWTLVETEFSKLRTVYKSCPTTVELIKNLSEFGTVLVAVGLPSKVLEGLTPSILWLLTLKRENGFELGFQFTLALLKKSHKIPVDLRSGLNTVVSRTRSTCLTVDEMGQLTAAGELTANASPTHVQPTVNRPTPSSLLNGSPAAKEDSVNSLFDESPEKSLESNQSPFAKLLSSHKQDPFRSYPNQSSQSRLTSFFQPTKAVPAFSNDTSYQNKPFQNGTHQDKTVPLPLNKPVTRGSYISQIAKELHDKRETRVPSKPQVIHPPREPGFNPKPVAKPEGPRQRTQPDPRTQSPTEDSSDSEIETEHGPLFQLGTKKIDSSKYTSLSVRTAPLPINVSREENRKTRLRLTMEPSVLHKQVLKWDYFNTSDIPPLNDAELEMASDTYKDAEHYIKSMQPLLLVETWQSIVNAKQETNYPGASLTIVERGACDDFIDLKCSIPRKEFQLSRIMDGDLILLQTVTEKMNRSSGVPHCFAKVKDGSVSDRNPKEPVKLDVRTFGAGQIGDSFSPGKVLLAFTVCSLKTAEREFCALMATPHYDLLPSILNASPSKPGPVNMEARNLYMKRMNLNESQADAVHKAITSPGFNLVQGPPGTGKTKTILAIIGAFFSHTGVFSETKASTTFGASKVGGKRVLVCAPSNAAVDELLLRLKAGITLKNGQKSSKKIVRLGRPDMVNNSVKEFILEEQVSKEMSSAANVVDSALVKEQGRLFAERDALTQWFAEKAENVPEQEVQSRMQALETLNQQISEKKRQLADQRARLAARNVEYRNTLRRIVEEADIVCATLSGSASSTLIQLQLTFPFVIIDEAAQCVELSSLIPLKYGCKQCVMVGDPYQLPPTVLSREASRLKYSQSLFVRMFRLNKANVSLLNVQFRMHPGISKFPSQEFYSGELRDAPDMDNKCARPWHENPLFAPYRFFAMGSQHEKAGNSLVNRGEATFAMRLVKHLVQSYKEIDFKGKIGIVTPYKRQAFLLRNEFQANFPRQIVDAIEFSSVDGFQGQEKDIIVMSCVRASDSSGIGFLADTRRMNVAITRARSSLWIIGSPWSLVTHPVWKNLVNDANRRGVRVAVPQRNLDFKEMEANFGRYVVGDRVPPHERNMRKEHFRLCSPEPGSEVESDKKRTKRDLIEPVPAESNLSAKRSSELESAPAKRVRFKVDEDLVENGDGNGKSKHENGRDTSSILKAQTNSDGREASSRRNWVPDPRSKGRGRVSRKSGEPDLFIRKRR